VITDRDLRLVPRPQDLMDKNGAENLSSEGILEMDGSCQIDYRLVLLIARAKPK